MNFIVQVGPIWFVAQYLFTVSLAKTSVTSNTIISSSSSLFTYIISILILREQFTSLKLTCIVAVMTGKGLTRGLSTWGWWQFFFSVCQLNAYQNQ
jgi:drug/metabolite transporter (DMT)-like permease